uniref:Matrin-type domain-containing protein n=1 Tax=Fagus sylvatica TaxID=28930 RepID=A0A2N9HQ60_FAGSY
MDREWGSKPGSGGAATAQNEAIDRRERLRRLALETIDLAKDPYFMRNHLGSYECKLCLTLHNNEGNYLAHTQGKRHQTNLAKRAAREAKEAPAQPQPHKRKPDRGSLPLDYLTSGSSVIGSVARRFYCPEASPKGSSLESENWKAWVPGNKTV